MNVRSEQGFSLLELMVVVAIVCILAIVSVSSYRDYTIKASIAALIPAADKVKDEVEDAHNQGTIFGGNTQQTYINSSTANKPFAMAYLMQNYYGCVDIGIDLAALKLDTSKQLILALCPYNNNGSIEWRCGYGSASYTGYVANYFPSSCQVSDTSLQDTTF